MENVKEYCPSFEGKTEYWGSVHCCLHNIKLNGNENLCNDCWIFANFQWEQYTAMINYWKNFFEENEIDISPTVKRKWGFNF